MIGPAICFFSKSLHQGFIFIPLALEGFLVVPLHDPSVSLLYLQETRLQAKDEVGR